MNPLSGKISSNSGATDAKKMLERLEMATNFAVRKGQTVFRGWKLREGNDYLKKGIAAKDLQANIMQKGVDLHIGIDIARLSIKERVRAIAVITGDADMIPAFQLAREEGVRVYLACLGQSVTRDLIVNTDCLIQDAEDLNNA